MISFFQGLLYTILMLLCLFMILIILLQRGKGGGLVGAFGGLGGSSAFGAKTGDVFMKITIYATFLWFILCLGGRYILLSHNSAKDSLVNGSHGNVEAPANPGGDAAATDATPATEATPAVTEATPAATDAVPATDTAPATDATPAADTAPAPEQ